MRQLAFILLSLLSLASLSFETSGLPFHNVGGFPADTLVSTPVGKVTIGNIRLNDRVLSLDLASGRVVESRVLRVGRTQVTRLVTISAGGHVVSVNPDHRFYDPQIANWIAASELRRLETILLNREGKGVSIDFVRVHEGRISIIDLKVENTENYFVGKEELLVHNFVFAIPVFTWVIGEGVVWAAATTLAMTAAATVTVLAVESLVEAIQDRLDQPTRTQETTGERTRNDPLPRHPRTKEPMPDPEGKGVPHTQLGTKQGNKGPYPQAREFDLNGKPVRDIDFTNHGRPSNHPNPHQHFYRENPTGGTRMRDNTAWPL